MNRRSVARADHERGAVTLHVKLRRHAVSGRKQLDFEHRGVAIEPGLFGSDFDRRLCEREAVPDLKTETFFALARFDFGCKPLVAGADAERPVHHRRAGVGDDQVAIRAGARAVHAVGDLVARRRPRDEVAEQAGTSAYEVLTNLGHRYHREILDRWPLNRQPALIAKSESFFGRHGDKSVFLARFTPGVRAVVPLFAGILRMQEREVLAAFRKHRCQLERAVRRGKWVTLLLRVR